MAKRKTYTEELNFLNSKIEKITYEIKGRQNEIKLNRFDSAHTIYLTTLIGIFIPLALSYGSLKSDSIGINLFQSSEVTTLLITFAVLFYAPFLFLSLFLQILSVFTLKLKKWSFYVSTIPLFFLILFIASIILEIYLGVISNYPNTWLFITGLIFLIAGVAYYILIDIYFRKLINSS